MALHKHVKIMAMDDQQLEDLKQFIDARISQTEARFDEKLEGLRKEMLDGFAGVSEQSRRLTSKWMNA
jgi:hypothetical protein